MLTFTYMDYSGGGSHTGSFTTNDYPGYTDFEGFTTFYNSITFSIIIIIIIML